MRTILIVIGVLTEFKQCHANAHLRMKEHLERSLLPDQGLIEKHYSGSSVCLVPGTGVIRLAIFIKYFYLERTNQLSLSPDKDLVDLCHLIEPYQVTKNH